MDRLVVKYRIETPLALEEAASAMARFQSAGTFVRSAGESDALRARFDARVENVAPLEPADRPSLPYLQDGSPHGFGVFRRGEVTLSLPLATVGTEWTGILATVCGSVFELREVSGIRLIDLELPPELLKAHPGPRFGVRGTRRLAGVAEGPIIASIIKPNVGLSPEETADRVRVLAEAGVDFIKDDEKMTSPGYSPLGRRVEAVMKVLREFRERTGKRVMFAFNITADDPEAMVAHHETVRRAGGSCVMVSINQVGIPAMAFLRRRSALPIHAHRNGWGMLTRHPWLGMDFRAYQKIWRLVGIDHLHVNGIGNKFWEPDDSVVDAVEACLTPIASESDRILPVLGSGMWAGQAAESYRRMGTLDLIYIAGGGIQGHPLGPAAGVVSIRRAWEAAVRGVPLDTYAREHKELAAAIAAFGSGR